MNFIFLEGCKRSGNHILVQWLRSFVDKSMFIENMFFRLEEDLDDVLMGKKSPGFEHQYQYIESNLSQELIHSIVSCEHPGLMTGDQINKVIELARSRGFANLYRLHILRDPINWMASYAKLLAGYKKFGLAGQHNATKKMVFGNFAKYHQEYWARWYRSFLLWSKIEDFQKINYNLFTTSLDYRKQLAGNLSLNWNEHVDSSAMKKEAIHGSSFKVGIDDNKTLNRYNYLIPMFMAFPIPEPILEACEENFPLVFEGFTEAIEQANHW